MADPTNPQPEPILYRKLLFTRYYAWFITASALDIVMTALVLSAGGREANPFASYVISRFGMHGAMAFKFMTAAFVIVCCEIIGRQDERKGRFVARFAIAIPAFAAMLGYFLIVRAGGVSLGLS